jgi:hypothetical protein
MSDEPKRAISIYRQKAAASALRIYARGWTPTANLADPLSGEWKIFDLSRTKHHVAKGGEQIAESHGNLAQKERSGSCLLVPSRITR